MAWTKRRKPEGDRLRLANLIDLTWKEVSTSDDRIAVATKFKRRLLDSPHMHLYVEAVMFVFMRLNQIARYGSNFTQDDRGRQEFFTSRRVAAAVTAGVLPRVHAIDPTADSERIVTFFDKTISETYVPSVDDYAQLGGDLLPTLILAMGFGYTPDDQVWTDLDEFLNSGPIRKAVRLALKA
ncbi:MAG: hypothetical protein QM774_12605 [Gordonia sp. (in: high G+C Gram-positive bacteria)]|uniref:hypothetical protein n=1 Tax=Gordonia sp. (in: high G+C Gram-positive bacteria) TaxID=84139 RepID=UPI0039E60D82